MWTSKRQEWILQMIKGPDINPVNNCPGHYSSRSTITITADEREITVRPSDVLDLSNAEFLVVNTNGRESIVPWDRITGLDFEEQKVTPPAMRPPLQTAPHRMLPFSLGRKVV